MVTVTVMVTATAMVTVSYMQGRGVMHAVW